MFFAGKNIFGLLSYRVLPLALLMSISLVSSAHIGNFRTLFVRVPGWKLSSLPVKVLRNLTVETCAQSCVREVEFECKSFDIDNTDSSCRLQNHTHDEPYISLQISSTVDHYRTAYEKLFTRLPDHLITYNHNRKIPGVTVEQCSRRCILEVNFKCRGFDYEIKLQNCWLTNMTVQTTSGIMVQRDTDYYERKTGGALESFINFGYGSLRILEGIQIYDKNVIGVTLDACAQLCLVQRAFKCNSFDYIFSEHSCKMSHLIAANTHGMNNSYMENFKVMHFEIKDEYLDYFYATPYAAVQGNNEKIFRKVTPNNCARKCLTEREFICRSFDYQIRDGTCLLGSRTGSDVGGLITQGLIQVHHFEMKPFLDCGGIYTDLFGNFASPNWPRNYAHNVYCSWNIIVPTHKIIKIDFLHFDLGPQSYDPCSSSNDRLIFSDISRDEETVTCGGSDLKQYISKTNNVTVTFISNANHDAKGFRAFYEADWPCGGFLTDDNGEIASVNWPNKYPALLTCEWTIRAPTDAKIFLSFTSFDLEEHINGPCDLAYDRVEIFDGYNDESAKLRSFCSSGAQKTVTSTRNVLYIKFHSDERVEKNGFHAVYKFIYQTTVPPETTTSKDITSASSLDVTTVVSSSISSVTSSASNVKDNETQVSLVAMFIEHPKIPPIYVDRVDENTVANDNSSLNGIYADDDVTRSTPDINAIPTDLRRAMLALAMAFLALFLVVLCVLFLVCRYYRKRIPKRRNVPNFQYTTEESVSLYDKDNMINGKVEQEHDEEINLPQPSPSDPPADVEFCNPMYRNTNEQIQTSYNGD